MSGALNLSVCLKKETKKKRNKKTKRQSISAYGPFSLFSCTGPVQTCVQLPPKSRPDTAKDVSYIKRIRKRDGVWKVLSVLYLMGLQRPSSPSAAFRQVWKSPLLTAAVRTGSKEQRRGRELPPQPPRTDKPPLNSAELCKQKPSNSGQAIFSPKEPEPT